MGSRKRGLRGKGRSDRSSSLNKLRVADISCGFGWNFMILDELNIDYSIKYVYHKERYMLDMFKSKYGTCRILDFKKDNRNLPKVDLLFYNLNKEILEDDSSEIENIFKLFEKKKPKILIMEETGSVLHRGSYKKGKAKDFCDRLLEIGYKNTFLHLRGSDIGFPNDMNRVYMVSCLDKEYEHESKKDIVLLSDLLDEEDISDYIINMFQRKTIKKSRDKYIYGEIDDNKAYYVPIYYSDRKILNVPLINRSQSSLLILDRRINVIRRVTNRELFRVMGYNDDCYYDFLKYKKESRIPRLINQLSLYPVKKNIVKNALKMLD